MNLPAKKIKLVTGRPGRHRAPARIGGSVTTVMPGALTARTGGGNTAPLLNRTFRCGLFPSCHLLKQSQGPQRIVQSVMFVI